MDFTPELLEKAKQAKSAQELAALAKENGVELNEEQAQAYYDLLHPAAGELTNEELDNVSGGGCHTGDGRLVVTVAHTCKHWMCRTCGTRDVKPSSTVSRSLRICLHCDYAAVCGGCKYMSYEKALWLCNYPRIPEWNVIRY